MLLYNWYSDGVCGTHIYELLNFPLSAVCRRNVLLVRAEVLVNSRVLVT